MNNTENADYKFIVKEGQPSKSGADDAPLSIFCEPITRELSIVGDKGFLSIKLKNVSSYREAQQFADMLNEKVSHISYTRT
jgi:hypothetical protein